MDKETSVYIQMYIASDIKTVTLSMLCYDILSERDVFPMKSYLCIFKGANTEV